MNLSREQLIFKALVALSEVVELARIKPVQPTAGFRFVLAWLYAHSEDNDRSDYDEFWHVVQNKMERAHSESEARYLRSSLARTALHGIARRAGVELTPDYECEIYQARMSKVERDEYRASANFKFSEKKRGR